MKTGTSALSLAALLSASLLAGCAPSGAKPAAEPAEPQAAPAAEAPAAEAAAPLPEAAPQAAPEARIPLAPQQVITWVSPYGIPQAMKVLDVKGDEIAKGLTELALQFWGPTEQGKVQYAMHEPTKPTDEFVAHFRDWAKSKGIRTILCVYNYNGSWDWDLAAKAFSVDGGETFAQALADEAVRLELDGVDIDLEGVGDHEADRAAFVAFLQKLSAKLKAKGLKLSVDSFHSPCYNAPNMSWWKDWVGVADQIHSMGYNDLYEGAVDSTLCDVKGIFRYTTQVRIGEEMGFPKGKMLVGMPVWVDSWGAGGRGSSVQDHLKEAQEAGTGLALWELEKWFAPEAGGWSDPATFRLLAEFKNGTEAAK